jgi:hypothetical protein
MQGGIFEFFAAQEITPSISLQTGRTDPLRNIEREVCPGKIYGQTRLNDRLCKMEAEPPFSDKTNPLISVSIRWL